MKNSVNNGEERKIGRWAMALQVCAALALLVAMALPAGAADDRAVKNKVAPVYPEIAKRMHVVGMVRVEATVDATGKVVDVKPVSGNHVLSIAAEDAVRKWRFEPGAGESKVQLAFNFD